MINGNVTMSVLWKALIICLLWVGLQTVDAQVLRNGSFEELETDRDNPTAVLAAHWGRWGNWFDRETSWDQTYSGDCAMVYFHKEIEQNDSSGIFQDVYGADPGNQCTFSIYARTDTADLNVQSIELRIEKEGGFDTWASRTYSADDVSATAWNELSVTGLIEGEGFRVLVIVTPAQNSDRDGILSFDDAELDVE